MKRIIASVSLLIWVVAVGAQSGQCPVQIKYPQWFFSSLPSHAVVGFPLQNKAASEDGYDRFCAYQQMRAKGTLNFYDVNGRLKHSQSNLNFYYDPNATQVSPSSLVAVDSFSVTSGNKIYLYSTDGDYVPLATEGTLCNSTAWPESSEQAGRTYGYGSIGLSYYDHVVSWVEAESNAVRDLLGQSAYYVASEQESNSDWKITEAIRYEYDLELSDIRIERRWVDFNDWSCHVVVSLPSNAIVPWQLSDGNRSLSDSSIAAINDPDTTTVQSEDITIGSYQWNTLYYNERKRQMNLQMKNKNN